MIRRIGLIGLGLMGRPMAKNLLNAGYEHVHDINRKAVDEVVGSGAKGGSSPKEVAASAEAMILSLPGDSEVEEVVLGKAGILDAAMPGSVLVDMSTVSPLTAKRMAEVLQERGIEMLDAPVSGGQEGAREGSLTIMVGGSRRFSSGCGPCCTNWERTSPTSAVTVQGRWPKRRIKSL
jgi:2-hydroxy-3-oxopropionate reductase